MIKNTYHLKDYEPNVEQFPPYIPNSKVRTDLTFFSISDNMDNYLCKAQIYSRVNNVQVLKKLPSLFWKLLIRGYVRFHSNYYYGYVF